MHFFYKPCLFKTDFEQAQKPLLCRNTVVPTSSSLCVLKRCKPFFLSHGPLTSTRKAIKYNFFIIILSYFSVRHSKSTKFLHLVHNEIRWRQDSTVLAAVRTAGASTVCKVTLGARGFSRPASWLAGRRPADVGQRPTNERAGHNKDTDRDRKPRKTNSGTKGSVSWERPIFAARLFEIAKIWKEKEKEKGKTKQNRKSRLFIRRDFQQIMFRFPSTSLSRKWTGLVNFLFSLFQKIGSVGRCKRKNYRYWDGLTEQTRNVIEVMAYRQLVHSRCELLCVGN